MDNNPFAPDFPHEESVLAVCGKYEKDVLRTIEHVAQLIDGEKTDDLHYAANVAADRSDNGDYDFLTFVSGIISLEGSEGVSSPATSSIDLVAIQNIANIGSSRKVNAIVGIVYTDDNLPWDAVEGYDLIDNILVKSLVLDTSDIRFAIREHKEGLVKNTLDK